MKLTLKLQISMKSSETRPDPAMAGLEVDVDATTTTQEPQTPTPADDVTLAFESTLPPKSTLLTLLPEIKRQIYQYLLTNPVLGTAYVVRYDSGHGASLSYDLWPAILRVCRQTNKYGNEVLHRGKCLHCGLYQGSRRPVEIYGPAT